MKKIASFGMSLAAACALVACGSKPGINELQNALKAPNATIDGTSASTALANNDSANASAGASFGVPSVGFAVPAIAQYGMALSGSGDLLAKAGADAGVTAICSVKSSAGADINAGTLGSTYKGSIHYEYKCIGTTAIEYLIVYNGFGGSVPAGDGKTATFTADGSATVRFAYFSDVKVIKVGTFVDMKGSYSDGTTSTSYNFTGGGASRTDGNDPTKNIVAVVFSAGQGKFCVVLAGEKNRTISRAQIDGTWVAFLGANGKFIARVEKHEGKWQVALFKQADCSLVDSSITPTPTCPTDSTTIDLDVSKLTDFTTPN